MMTNRLVLIAFCFVQVYYNFNPFLFFSIFSLLTYVRVGVCLNSFFPLL